MRDKDIDWARVHRDGVVMAKERVQEVVSQGKCGGGEELLFTLRELVYDAFVAGVRYRVREDRKLRERLRREREK